MSIPNTAVWLLTVPLENDYLHTFYFESKEKQIEYFSQKVVTSSTNFTYQRKEKTIRYPANVDDIINCNYVMYKNGMHTDKWYFAFITKLEYINDNLTAITIETDVIQTWLFDYTVKSSFIEREHVNDDTIGLHTVPEQVETGDYVINDVNKNLSLLHHTLVMGVTVDLNDFEESFFGNGTFNGIGGGAYNGIYSGVKYYKVSFDEANAVIKQLAKTGQIDAIVSIFVVPSSFVSATYPKEGGFMEVESKLSVDRKEWVNTFGVNDRENLKPTALNGYIPKNNKLFTYPYCYMLMSNNSGGSAVYKYECFNTPNDEDNGYSDNECLFYIDSVLTPSMSISISPRYYNNAEINSLERLTLGKFPICAWTSDVYTNWLTQNAVNIPLSIGGAVVSTGLAIAGAVLAPSTGGASAIGAIGAIGAGVGGISTITSTVGEVYQHSLQPPQAEGNVNSGDVAFSSGILTFTAYQMTIKQEYAKLIDGFFNVFGYKVNRIKTPNINHRKNFWYTKTIDVNIDGNLPNDDLQKIKSCYNNGITFWKNPANIQNYNVDNGII